jgi:hypothetical protein
MRGAFCAKRRLTNNGKDTDGGENETTDKAGDLDQGQEREGVSHQFEHEPRIQKSRLHDWQHSGQQRPAVQHEAGGSSPDHHAHEIGGEEQSCGGLSRRKSWRPLVEAPGKRGWAMIAQITRAAVLASATVTIGPVFALADQKVGSTASGGTLLPAAGATHPTSFWGDSRQSALAVGTPRNDSPPAALGCREPFPTIRPCRHDR